MVELIKTIKNNSIMYRLQWTWIRKNGKNVDVKDFVYHDTSFEYETEQEAMEDRILLQAQATDKYLRIVKVE